MYLNVQILQASNYGYNGGNKCDGQILCVEFWDKFLHLPLRSHGFCKEEKLMSAFYHQYARSFLSASYNNHALLLKMLSDMRT